MAKEFIVVQIKSGLKVLKIWYGASLAEETVLLDVYNAFATGNLIIISELCHSCFIFSVFQFDALTKGYEMPFLQQTDKH